MRRGTKLTWKYVAFAALATLAAGLLLGLATTAQKPDRVLLPAPDPGRCGPGTGTRCAGGGTLPNGWRLLEPARYENMSVFPIVTAAGSDTSAFITLDEALASGDVIVAERGSEVMRRSRDGRPIPVQGGATVNQLVLLNRGKKPLVLLAGEVVSGGKQDRVIAKDRIVAPGAEPLPLDVFCVDRGRWSGQSASFSGAGLMVHPSVREKAQVDKKQDEVWAAIRSGSTSAPAAQARAEGRAPEISERTLNSVVVEAQSESYDKIVKSHRVQRSVEAFAEEVARRFARATGGLKGEQVIGVVVAYGSEVAWSDSFASAALFDRYWPKLLRSYVVEALARPGTRETASLNDAREFLMPLVGREVIESEPGVYRWREITSGHYAQIDLDSMAGRVFTLHRVKIHRTS